MNEKLRKLISTITFSLMLIIFSGCGSKETVELDAWKDKLITQPPLNIENPLPGVANDVKQGLDEGKDRVTEALGEGTSSANDMAQSLGVFISQTLKEWAGNNDLPGTSTEESQDITTPEPEKDDSGKILQEKAEETESGSRIKVQFERVVDGDTIVVNYENESARIRLIGVNTAESVHPDTSKNTEEGKYASDFLKEYMKDTENVWLEFDLETNDDYGRILAYVWLNESGTDIDADMLNGILLKLGWAEVMTINPNVKYENEFEQIAVTEE